MEHNFNLNHPYLGYPAGITWPSEIKKLIDAYEKAWSAYDGASIDYLETSASADGAGAADKQLLIDAIAAGKEDPGTPNESIAARLVVVAAARLQLAATNLGAAEEAVLASFPAHRAELIGQASKLEKSRIETFQKTMAKARDDAEKATREATAIGSTLNFFAHLTAGTVNYRIEAPNPTIIFPPIHELAANSTTNVIDLLEAMIVNPTPKPAGTPAPTVHA